MSDPANLYAQYEASLTGLQSVPASMAQGLSAAQKQHDAACRAADTAYQQQTARITNLRRSTEARYDDTVAALKAHDVLLPSQIRPEANVPGDDDALRRAVDAHAAAISAMDTNLRGASDTARRVQDDAARRAAGAQQATDALRIRQEKLHAERKRATEKSRLANEAAFRRRRLWIAAFGAGAVVFVALISIIIFTALNQ